MLMKKSDELFLESIPGATLLSNEVDASCFQDLESLQLYELENLESFVLTSPPITSFERPTLFDDKVDPVALFICMVYPLLNFI